MGIGKSREEELFLNALDDIKEGCQIIGYDWRHIYINATALKHIAHSREELMQHTLMEIFPGAEHMLVFSAFQRCLTERVSQQVSFTSEPSDGSKRWYESNVQPIAAGIFILTSDITERKKIEADRDRLISAIEQSGECIIILDTNRLVQYVNPIFEKLTGKKTGGSHRNRFAGNGCP